MPWDSEALNAPHTWWELMQEGTIQSAVIPKFALSIRQPWAWAIINAGKDIENRDWPTRFRGPVAIHAAKGMTSGEYDGFIRTIHEVSLSRPFPAGAMVPHSAALPRGGIVGVAEIVDCVEANESPWFFGRYGFVLSNARSVEFIPVKGALGFFDWRKSMANQHA